MYIHYMHNALKYLRHQDMYERGKKENTKQKC